MIGIGSHESRGMKRGVVVDIESTVQSIKHAIEEAELMAGCEIRLRFYASISGSHTNPHSPGIVPVASGEVTYQDLETVLQAAKSVAIPPTRKSCCDSAGYIVDNSEAESAILSVCRAFAWTCAPTSLPARFGSREYHKCIIAAACSR